ncbi:MAG: hypothetical protein KKB21_02745 [Nanoarchaeota archaeon]|nr:hypothetical protein [Nanoarchaeota archaeon]
MAKTLKIGIDADNGDFVENDIPTRKIISAVSRISEDYPLAELVVAGNREKVLDALGKRIPKNVRIIPSTAYISRGEKIHCHMPGSSLNNLVREARAGNIEGIFTIGNTANVGKEAIGLRRITGVIKPTLLTPIPVYPEGVFFLTDIGATSMNQNQQDGKLYRTAIEEFVEEIYCQGIIATVYARTQEVLVPKLGLLTVGQEEHKGSDWVLRTDELFKSKARNLEGFLEYAGKIEQKHAMRGQVDIALSDGHTGNQLLKLGEEIIYTAKTIVKDIAKNLRLLEKLACTPAALVLRRNPLVRRVIESYNPTKYNAALLLGYRGIISKGHGDSSEEAVYKGIKRALDSCGLDLGPKIEEAVKRYMPK